MRDSSRIVANSDKARMPLQLMAVRVLFPSTPSPLKNSERLLLQLKSRRFREGCRMEPLLGRHTDRRHKADEKCAEGEN
jgi:hypothetical protein